MKIAFKIASACAAIALMGVSLPAAADDTVLSLDVTLNRASVAVSTRIAGKQHDYSLSESDIEKSYDRNSEEITDPAPNEKYRQLKMHRDSQNTSVVALGQSGMTFILAWDFAYKKVRVDVYKGATLLAANKMPHGSLDVSLAAEEAANLTVVQTYTKTVSGVATQFISSNSVTAVAPLAALVAANTAKVRYQTFLANGQYYRLINSKCPSYGIADGSVLELNALGQRDVGTPFNPTATANLTDMTGQWTFGYANSFVGNSVNQTVPIYTFNKKLSTYNKFDDGVIGNSTQVVSNQGPVTNNVIVKLSQNESLGECTPYKLSLDGFLTVNSNGSMSLSATYLNAPYQEVDVYQSSTGTWTPLLWSSPNNVYGLGCMLGTSVSAVCQKNGVFTPTTPGS